VADFDLLARLPGVQTVDLIATDAVLGSGFHQRIHEWLPGLDEIEWNASAVSPRPVLSVPAATPDRMCFSNRDREEELIGIARRLKADRREHTGAGLDPPPLDGVAVVYRHPLAYLYLARSVFGAAGIPFQTSDTLPLAAEPFAAALDLVFDFVAASFTRSALIALLRSPYFTFADRMPIDRWAISALDRALSEARYLGELEHLSQLSIAWQAGGEHRQVWPALHGAVSAAEELQRLAPVIAPLVGLGVPVSVDTMKSEVAKWAFDQGAAMINDVWGLQRDSAMAPIMSQNGLPVVIMHNRDAVDPALDIMADIEAFFARSLAIAAQAGIARDRMVLDPGIGFGKTPEQSIEAIGRLGRLRSFGLPLLVGASRKRFIDKLSPAPPDQRLGGSIAAHVLSVLNGAAIIRVHDVAETVQALKVAAAIRGHS